MKTARNISNGKGARTVQFHLADLLSGFRDAESTAALGRWPLRQYGLHLGPVTVLLPYSRCRLQLGGTVTPITSLLTLMAAKPSPRNPSPTAVNDAPGYSQDLRTGSPTFKKTQPCLHSSATPQCFADIDGDTPRLWPDPPTPTKAPSPVMPPPGGPSLQP